MEDDLSGGHTNYKALCTNATPINLIFKERKLLPQQLVGLC